MTINRMKLRDIFDNLELSCDKFEHYFGLYERHLGRFVGKSPMILEIGVQFGGSAEMWNKYFGKGTFVYGVDISPQCNETNYLKLLIGDQGSQEFWMENFSGMYKYFDIIIDDGSHNNPDQITTLLNCYNLIKDDGVYWCEDTHTSYYFNVRVSDGGCKNKDSFTEFAKNIVDVLSSNHAKEAIGVGPFDGPRVPPILVSQFDNIQGIHFYDSVIVIDKGPRLKFSRIIHKKKV